METQEPSRTEQPVAGAPTPDEAAATQTEAAEISANADEAGETYAPATPESLLADARELLAKDAADISNDEIRRLRQHFNSLCKAAAGAEDAAEQAAESAEDNADEARESETEAEFQTVIAQLREKKAEWTAQQEALRAKNLERKNEIIAEIYALAEDTDNVNRTFPRYRELQDEFNATGEVDPTEETAVWKRFQDAREKFSDNLKINKELRDYDFKKNLAEKEVLLAEAVELANVDDVIAAYRRLQEMHNKWRQIGPVAKELRDDIWNRFRDASAEVNKRYQAYFEARKARETENEQAKTLLCERMEALDYAGLKSFNGWEEMTKTILAIQEEWKTLGFASRKMNRQLFARFREACDRFFAAKAEFFRNTRDELARNLARKQELADKAEALKDSTDWRNTTDEVIALQKEWKTIGTVPKKYSDALWKRFSEACDHFFEQKKKSTSGIRQTEAANLKTKREIIGHLSALTETDDKDAAAQRLRELQAQWQETGHVPFREKDKIHEAYRSAVDAVRRRFDMIESKARMNRFTADVAEIEGDDNKLFRERERLVRILEARRGELRTYENNIGFLSSKSKSGDSLVKDFQRRADRLRADIADIAEKIKIIDSKLS